MPSQRNVWNYVPPHRGASVDGGSPQDLSADSSISGGFSDRSTVGSTTSGFQYTPEAPYDGRSYVRRDGQWRELFEGTEALDGFSDLVDLVVELQQQVEKLQTQVDSLVIDAAGWDEVRIRGIETTQQNIIKGDVVFEKINCKNNVTAYVEAS